jgi:hypothetical protein
VCAVLPRSRLRDRLLHHTYSLHCSAAICHRIMA